MIWGAAVLLNIPAVDQLATPVRREQFHRDASPAPTWSSNHAGGRHPGGGRPYATPEAGRHPNLVSAR